MGLKHFVMSGNQMKVKNHQTTTTNVIVNSSAKKYVEGNPLLSAI